MFGLFKKKEPKAAEEYCVYYNQIGKYRQLVKELKNQLEHHQKAFVFCFFDDTRTEMKRLLESAGIPFTEDMEGHKDAVLLLDQLQALPTINFNGVPLVLPEIHPLRSFTENVLSAVGPSNAMLCFTSLDSPFFKIFGDGRLMHLMQKMGVEENERISHTMIDKSIQRAQKKTESKVFQEKPATSLEAWVAINLNK